MTGRFGNGKKALEFLRDNDVDWIDANNVVSDIVKDICEQVAYGTLTPEGLRINFSQMCSRNQIPLKLLNRNMCCYVYNKKPLQER